jgi:hypothetical protein
MTEILSEEDIRALFLAAGFTVKDGHADLKTYVYGAARAVERAAVEKLAAMGGDLPEPTTHWPHFNRETGIADLATPSLRVIADHIRAERAKGIAAGVAQERARCVAVCKTKWLHDVQDEVDSGYQKALYDCIDAIRSGAGAPDEKLAAMCDASEAKGGGR